MQLKSVSYRHEFKFSPREDAEQSIWQLVMKDVRRVNGVSKVCIKNVATGSTLWVNWDTDVEVLPLKGS